MLTASALAMLGAAAWWWVTWPERTANEFARRLAERDEFWKQMLRPRDRADHVIQLIERFGSCSPTEVHFQSCSLLDFVRGKRRFESSTLGEV